MDIIIKKYLPVDVLRKTKSPVAEELDDSS